MLGGNYTMKRIMIADDSKASRLYLKCILDELITEPCEFHFACNGAEAVALHAQTHPELSFIDLNMPVKSGMEAITEIRQVSPEAKIIILTADTQSVTRNRALALGAIDFMNKPITLEAFQNQVPKWL